MALSRRNFLLGHWLHYGRFVGVPFRGYYGRGKVRLNGESVAGLCIRIGQSTIEVKRLDCIGLLWFAQRNWIFMRWMVEWEKLACYWLYGTDGPDRPDGEGLVWRERCQRDLDWEHRNCLLRCRGRQEVASATTFTGVAGGAEYLCQCRKIIIIYCTQIRTAIQYKMVQIVRRIQLYYKILLTVQTMKPYQEITGRKFLKIKLKIITRTQWNQQKIFQNIGFLEKYRPISVGGLDSYYVNI